MGCTAHPRASPLRNAFNVTTNYDLIQPRIPYKTESVCLDSSDKQTHELRPV